MRPGSSPLPHTLELLLDVRINVSVEVGRVEMPVRQVMELGPGAVIELERSASEPVEIYANGRCIGRGEVVVVGEQFGVRVTELGSPSS
jgi:flagellar motor switch protein FliN/FliY